MLFRSIRSGGSLGRWYNDFLYIEKDKDNMNKSKSHHNEKLLFNAFNGWIKEHRNQVTLPKLLGIISRRQYVHNIGYTLMKIESEIAHKSQGKENNKNKMLLRFATHIAKIGSNTILRTFTDLVHYSAIQKMNKELLRRCLLKLLQRKLYNAFHKWMMKSEQGKLINDIEFKGETAKAAEKLEQRRRSTMKFLSSIGKTGQIGRAHV